MYKYLSVFCALISVVLFYSHPLPYSSWISLAILMVGIVLGIVSFRKEPSFFANIALTVNTSVFIVFLLGLFVRVFIWNRP